MVAITLLPGIAAPVRDQLHRQPASLIALSVLLVAMQSLPLWWRRRHPLAVLLIIAVPQVIRIAAGLSLDASAGALAFAVYAVSVSGRPPVRLAVGGLAVLAVILSVATRLAGVSPGYSPDYLSVAPVSLVAWVIGDYIRSRRQFVAELVARHQEAREQAAEEERLRIARELHDVVAHNVSAMAIQAGAARVSRSSGGEALRLIETTARDTLSELNSLLGVLRKDPGAQGLSPQPGLDQVEGLLRPVRDAGVAVTLKVAGERRPLPAALDLSAYRIVQEALTNVLKHAQASKVEVVIQYQPDTLVLTTSDNGSGSGALDGASAGHGLIGMRERVELFNGELGTTSSSLGGFTVRAKLPLRQMGHAAGQGPA